MISPGRIALVLSLLVSLAGPPRAAAGGDRSPPGLELTVYHVGNSLTRNIPLQRLQALFAAAGGRYTYGTQLGGGHRLSQHLVKRNHQNAPGEGTYNTVAPFGEYDRAFREHRFDAVILQPYLEELDRAPVSTPGPPYFRAGDLQSASALIDYARGRTPPGSGRWDLEHPNSHRAAERFYIYATWPTADLIMERGPSSTYAAFYAQPYTGGIAPTADFFRQLVTRLNELHRDLAVPVRIIPAGEVFARLDERIRSDSLPGLTAFYVRHQAYYRTARRNNPKPSRYDPEAFQASAGVLNFYADGVHLNDQPHDGPRSGTIGSYVAALTLFATLSGRSPVGLTAAPYEMFDADADRELIRALQQVVWDVVAGHPHTGVSRDPVQATRP